MKQSAQNSLSVRDDPIPRPDITVAQIVLLILADIGRADFKRISGHPMVRSLGAVRSENSFYTALARLKRRRLITRSSDHAYELTSAGEFAALKAYVRKEFTELEKKNSLSSGPATLSVAHGKGEQRWDGRWRIVFFDVPETQRPVRDYMRGVLKRAGFYEFQRSMWIHPYKLPSFISRLMEDPKLRKYARVMTTYDIDYDDDLRRHFKLT